MARTMFDLSPKSTIPMSGPSSSWLPMSMIDDGETLPTKSWSSQRGTARARSDRVGAIHDAGLRHDRPEAAMRPQVPGQRPGVDAGDGRDRRRRAAGPRAGGRRRGRRPSRWPRPGPGATGRADWSSIDEPAVVADEGVGHDDDLPGVRRVGADLLVAGLAGVHDEVATGRDGRPERDARERPSRPRAPATPDRDRRSAGSTIADARGGGGTITRRRPRCVGQQMTHPPRGRGGLGRARSSSLLRRPHGTGTPASQDWP